MEEVDPILRLRTGPSKLGGIIGSMVGVFLSIALIGLQHNALYHARLYVDVARVMAAHDVRNGIDRLEDFQGQFKADRFTETSYMAAVPAKLRICGAVALKDKELLGQAVAQTSAQYERWLQSDEGRRYVITSPSGLIYPLSTDTQLEIRAAMVCEKWDEAIQLADVGLKKAQEFWDDMGGIAEDSEQIMNPNSKVTVATLRNLDRYYLTCRAWSQARVERYELALTDIRTLIDEPVAWQTPDQYIVPEMLLLRAAVEHQLGQTELAAQTYSDAMFSSHNPVEFGPVKSAQVPHGWWLMDGQFVALDASWVIFRSRNFGLPQWWARPYPEAFSYIMSFRENPSDLVDEIIRDREFAAE